jgi:GntR family transcriptional repressor for pyruvate dehydrogenase complex
MNPITRVSVADAVVQNLKEHITSGELSVGEKMPTEQEICSLLHVSRSTVREAFRVLQAMGFVEMKPGKGAFVAKTTEENSSDNAQWFSENELQFIDFMELRMAIEPLAARLAVMRATEDEIEELKKIHSAFNDAMDHKDVVRLVTLDEAFHGLIGECTKNKLLISINKKILSAFKEYRGKSFSSTQIFGNAREPHEKIMHAIIDRDAEKASAAMAYHLQVALNDLEKISEKYRKQ